MKRYKLSFILALILVITIPVMALAATTLRTITVTESAGNAYANYPLIYSVNNTSLVSQGKITPTGLDTRILSSGVSIPHLLADDKTLFVGNVANNAATAFSYTAGNAPLTSMPVIVGNGGYVTTTDAAKLEPSDNFQLDVSAGLYQTGDLLKKLDALKINYDASTQVLTATTGPNASPDYTLTANAITNGSHAIRLKTIASSSSMEQPLFSTKPKPQSSDSTNYVPVIGDYAFTPAGEAAAQQIISSPGTISNLYIKATGAPGGADSYTYTLRVNGVDTTLTATISAAGTSASDLTHTVSVSAGDLISYKRVWSATANATNGVTASALFTGAAQVSILSSIANDTDTNATAKITFGKGATAASYTYGDYMPTSGAFSRLYVSAVTAGSYTVTMYKNGVATALTATLTGVNLVASDLVNSVSVSATDQVYFYVTPNGGPTSQIPKIGVTFSPDINGESLLFGYANIESGDFFPIASANFSFGYGGSVNFSGNYQISPIDGIVRKLYAYQTASGTATFSVYKNDSSTPTGLACNVVGGTGSDLTHNPFITAGDLLSMKDTIGASTDTFITSIVYYVPASTAGLALFVDDMVSAKASTAITKPVPDNANDWVFTPLPYINYIKLQTGN